MTLPAMRVGEGWDTHALVLDRPLILGGVTIPHTHGLLGHSDADALLHAITDALLGAAALGDIGRHFPDTDAQFKGADSVVLLQEAARRVRAQGYAIGNVDSTVVAQAPRLAAHKEAMRAHIARALGIAPEQVNVKAKTAERLGPVARGWPWRPAPWCCCSAWPCRSAVRCRPEGRKAANFLSATATGLLFTGWSVLPAEGRPAL